MVKRRILLVDDEPAILLTLKALLEIHGFEVETASSARDAKAKLRASMFHMVITDMRMENEEAGLEVARAAKKTPYQPAVALLTAFPLTDDVWRDDGADEMLVKPMNSQVLIQQLEALLVAHEDRKKGPEKVPALAASAGKDRRKATPRVSSTVRP
ncbi:MAG TPA: response regulator [Acidobacteriaceae bacterium]|nr:response regulator [Acidobacteriaceae bacterium]